MADGPRLRYSFISRPFPDNLKCAVVKIWTGEIFSGPPFYGVCQSHTNPNIILKLTLTVTLFNKVVKLWLQIWQIRRHAKFSFQDSRIFWFLPIFLKIYLKLLSIQFLLWCHTLLKISNNIYCKILLGIHFKNKVYKNTIKRFWNYFIHSPIFLTNSILPFSRLHQFFRLINRFSFNIPI